MAEYDPTNRFTLRKNKNPKNEKSPPYTGSINVDGSEYWLNAWIQEKGGDKFFSGSIRRKEELGIQSAPKKLSDQLDDDIPF
jgi:hypothetical protein